MMGAIPTIGMALTRLPTGSKPRRKKGILSATTATLKPTKLPNKKPGITALIIV